MQDQACKLLFFVSKKAKERIFFGFVGFRDFLMVHRSTADRHQVITYHNDGLSNADIARKTGFDKRFIARWVNRAKEGLPIDDNKRSGRPRKRTNVVEKKVEAEMSGKRKRSSRVVARDLKRQKVADISYRTVQRAAHNRGLKPFKRPKTSRLTPAHKKERLKFANANMKKDWSSVMFSDEHKFKQFKGGNPRHDQVWARCASQVPPKEVERWSLVIDVWAGISCQGKTKLYFYTGGLNAQGYQDALRKTLLPGARDIFNDEKDGWELQQDKATAHTACSTKRFLQQENIAVVDGWPTKGDDINPIENLWAILDERLEERKFTTTKGMKKAIREEWDNVDQDLLDNLIGSVPDRLRRVIKAQGASIKRVK